MSRPLNMIQERFRGGLMGVLVGDCYGAPFECKQVDANKLIEEIGNMSKSNNILKFTDDSAMTKSTCRSLILNKGFNAKHLAKEFTESYFRQPYRGYGAAVRLVFGQLRDTKYQDPFGPASRQFDGSGSYGNGAAMRCIGIALFAHKMKYSNRQMLDLVENCSKITHSNPLGVRGAVLLVHAVRYVLSVDEESLNENEFLDSLIRYMNDLETPSNDTTFTDKLNQIKKTVDQLSISGEDVSQKEIVERLGNDVSAPNSVPLAIYSFIRGISKFTDSYRFESEFTRTLHWAISCGGDTDTIAAMACGLCGAYLGISKIPENIYDKCEDYADMISLADQMTKL